jgi:hypothetical protein
VTILALVAGVALAAGAVLLVALPFLREPAAADDRLDAPTDAEEARLALLDERDRALGALRELEFDHRTGKITDDDYQRDLGPLRRAAALTLRRIDELVPKPETIGGQRAEEERVTDAQPVPMPVPEPAPPPDEGTPPVPAPVPEPAPPPDEGTPPRIPPSIPQE